MFTWQVNDQLILLIKSSRYYLLFFSKFNFWFHLKKIMYVNSYSKWLNKYKEIYTFTCLRCWSWRILLFLCRVKNFLPKTFNFPQFHKHYSICTCRGVNLNRFIKKRHCYCILIIFNSWHVVLDTFIIWCIKSRTRLFTYFSSFLSL